MRDVIGRLRRRRRAPEPPARVVKLFETGQQQAFSGRRFVGRVDAVSTVNLAFQVGGRLTTFPAVQGTTLAKGELIAQLDQTDYALQVRAAEAELTPGPSASAAAGKSVSP